MESTKKKQTHGIRRRRRRNIRENETRKEQKQREREREPEILLRIGEEFAHIEHWFSCLLPLKVETHKYKCEFILVILKDKAKDKDRETQHTRLRREWTMMVTTCGIEQQQQQHSCLFVLVSSVSLSLEFFFVSWLVALVSWIYLVSLVIWVSLKLVRLNRRKVKDEHEEKEEEEERTNVRTNVETNEETNERTNEQKRKEGRMSRMTSISDD